MFMIMNMRRNRCMHISRFLYIHATASDLSLSLHVTLALAIPGCTI
jgi:hypothetical protein